MKTLLKLLYVVMIVLALVTAIWFLLVLVNGGSGTFVDDIMMIPIGDVLVFDIAVYVILGWFALIAFVRMWKSIGWLMLLLANVGGAFIWSIMEQSSWDEYVPYIIVSIIVLMAANVVLNLVRPMRIRLVH